MNLKKSILTLVASAALVLPIGLNSGNQAHASYKGHYTTPTELRGNWYNGYGHIFAHMHIFKHSVYMDGHPLYIHKYGKHNQELLYIKKYKKGQAGGDGLKGYGGTNYVFTGKQKMGDPTTFWLSHKRIHGKRVMKTYINMGGFYVWTRQKLHHKYNYEYHGTQYLNQIGR